jgi:DNA repair protein RadA/Sms
MGKCPECGEWNSLVETIIETSSAQFIVNSSQLEEKIYKLSQVKGFSVSRIPTGFSEFDRVLGGGIVPGSIVLISGDPGIGKSTLLLQAAIKIASSSRGPVSSFLPANARSSKKSGVNQKKNIELRVSESPSRTATPEAVLYVSGEESPQQVKIRADRISKIPDNLFILPETDVDMVIAASEKVKPKLLIIDSIQTLTTSRLSGSAGSVGQLRECSQILQRYAKTTHTPIFIVGHVTKEGVLAGPKVLEHLVDTVLSLEGDDMYTFRLLRSNKNRFGSTFEVGVFEMQEAGMIQVDNPSGVFLSHRIGSRAGSVVVCTIAGGRPILAEIQSLVTPTIFPVPTRRVTGLDFSRVQVVMASLSKVAKVALGNMDVYVSVAGGLKVTEPASDLGVALAIASAVYDKPVRAGICAFAEVGLLGELRPVGNAKARMSEAKRMGFSNFISAEKFKTLDEAINYAIVK